jgi:hypothetical protein
LDAYLEAVNETGRGVLIFVAALLTIWLWAPLSNQPSRSAQGVVMSDSYFGPLHYLVLHTELHEPTYTIEKRLDRTRLAITALLSAALWTFVVLKVRGKPLVPPDSATDRTDAQ